MPVSATLARGPRRRLRPAFRWVNRPTSTTVLLEGFETAASGLFPWPGAPYVAMAEGGATPPANWEIGHGAQSLFSPGPTPTGGYWAAGGFLGYVPPGGASFFRRTVTGLPPGRRARGAIVGAMGVTVSASDTNVTLGFRVTGSAWTASRLVGLRHGLTAWGETTAGGTLDVDFGALGGGSGQTLCGFDNLVVELAGEPDGTDDLLVFPVALDEANAYPRLRAGSRSAGAAGGDAQLWRPGGPSGRDHLLTGLIRWIPRRDAYLDAALGLTIRPWDGPGGWRQFVSYARDGQPLVFYPDVTDLATTIDVAWDAPMAGPPEPEGNRHWRQEFVLRALATDAHPTTSPFRGY